jgi:hypothetical protein
MTCPCLPYQSDVENTTYFEFLADEVNDDSAVFIGYPNAVQADVVKLGHITLSKFVKRFVIEVSISTRSSC